MPRNVMIAPEHDQQDAEDAREVAGSHARGGAERVPRADPDGDNAERDEQHAGPEILRTANHHGHIALPWPEAASLAGRTFQIAFK